MSAVRTCGASRRIIPNSSCISGPRPIMPQNSSRRADVALDRQQAAAALDLVADAAEQLLEAAEVERLAQVVHRAELDRLDRGVDRRVAGHQDAWQSRSTVADRAQHVEPADVRHPQIDGGKIVMALAELGERLGAVGAQCDVESCPFAHGSDELANGTVVIDDQQRRAWWVAATGVES